MLPEKINKTDRYDLLNDKWLSDTGQKSKSTDLINQQLGDLPFASEPEITKDIVSKLEQGSLNTVNAVVLHRTGGASMASAIATFKASGIGTHFIIDKDGTIKQTANTDKYTYHIGKVHARCMEEGTCSAEEAKKIKSFGWSTDKIHDNEKTKNYPERYPINADSLGIEVVGQYSKSTKTWDQATARQKTSINFLIKKLQKAYNLTDRDIYEHDKISYKTAGEGGDLYSGGN